VRTRAAVPDGFIVLGGILLAVLAANERFAGCLGLPRMRKDPA